MTDVDPPYLADSGEKPARQPTTEDVEAVLDAASRLAHALSGVTPKPRPKRRFRPVHRASGFSGARPDARDPKSLSATVAGLISVRGWQRNVTIGGIEAKWDSLVGEAIAKNSTPEAFSEGILTIRTRTTAWANQLNWLSRDLLTKIQAELGPDIVQELKILGPVAPSWSKGRLRVKGRGPRDTYG